jgi:WD40 repeat protein
VKFVLLHAARPLWPWLIFDVGQDIMRPISLKRAFQVRFSPDGALCVSTSRDVKAIHIASRKKAFTSHPLSNPSDLAFTPDGNFLSVKSTSGRIAILDSASGATVGDFQNDRDGEGSNIAFSECGTFFVDGSWSGFLRVRERTSGQVVFERKFPHTMIHAVSSANRGSVWLSTHCPKATVHDRPPESDYFLRWSWPLSDAEPETLRFRAPFVRSSALSPDGRLLAVICGAPPTSLQIFSLADQSIVHTQQVTSGGTASAIRWTPCSRYLGFVQKGLLSVIEAASFQAVCHHVMEYPSSIDFSSDGCLVALGSWSSGKVVPFEKQPNKAPEPTPGSVTPRASS